VMPHEVGVTSNLHPHDHHYGLGAREHAAAAKLALVLRHHEPVLDALVRFAAAGHAVAIVIGNHDIELSWPEVQAVFLDAVSERARRWGLDADVRASFTFHRWFFYVRDLVWIEHGHQYDPYCSFESQLEPATDAVEIDPTLGGLLPRYVVPRLELRHRAWEHSLREYAGLLLSRRTYLAFRAYLDVYHRMVAHWRARRDAVDARDERARHQLSSLARASDLSEGLLAEIAASAPSPVVVSLSRIVRAMMLDRLVLATAAPLLVGLVCCLPADWLLYGVALVGGPLCAGGWFALGRREPTNPTESMRRAAHRIRARMGVPFVVMGHSHRPMVDADEDGAWLNTGHWVPGDREKAFTHVRVELGADGGVTAALLQWRGDGVRAFGPDLTLGGALAELPPAA
jgi:hypothetical protein